MPIARLYIAYDGSRFAGWAAQPGQRTVQGEVESALERIPASDRAHGRRADRRASTRPARWRASSTSGELPTSSRALNAVLAGTTGDHRGCAGGR